MSETTLLRTSAIVRNASVGDTLAHGAVKSGQLPLVQVRMVPGGPQVQEQQKSVEILPPRDAQSAMVTGGLPMVMVKMTQQGPQLDDGRDQQVVIKNTRHAGVAAGGLPQIQVKMTPSGPQVQTLPNVHGGPPQIPSAPPALSAQRGSRTQGAPAYVVAAPAPARQVALPIVPAFATEQLMLFRHLVGKYLGELLAAAVPAVDSAESEGSAGSEDKPQLSPHDEELAKLAELTISTLDEAMIATAVRAAAAEEAAAVAASTPAAVNVPPRAQFSAATSIAPAPSASYVAGPIGGRPQGPARAHAPARPQGFIAARPQRNAGMAPRRVARPGGPLPVVIVKMEGRQAVVQNQAEVAQARAAAAAGAELPETLPNEAFEGAAPAQG